MKNKIVLIVLFFSFLSVKPNVLFSQESKTHNMTIGYGSGFFLPSKGLTHNFTFQARVLERKQWRVNGEFLAAYGGPWAFSYATDGSGTGNLSPYKAFILSAGANVQKLLVRRKNFEFGVSGGLLLAYKSYQIPEIIEFVPIPNGASVKGFIKKTKDWGGIVSIALPLTRKFKNISFSLIPSYYYLGKKRSNFVLFLTVSI